MKKLSLAIFAVSIFTLSGCSVNTNGTNQASIKSQTTVNQYSSKFVSVEFPQAYTAHENGSMLRVVGPNGEIIIGGFIPSVGHPEPDKKELLFQMVSYTKDPKTESDAIPAALYYRQGDESTKNELLTILATVKKLP